VLALPTDTAASLFSSVAPTTTTTITTNICKLGREAIDRLENFRFSCTHHTTHSMPDPVTGLSVDITATTTRTMTKTARPVGRSAVSAEGGDYYVGGGSAEAQALIAAEGLRSANASELNGLASPRDVMHGEIKALSNKQTKLKLMPPKSHNALTSFRFVSLCCAQRIAVWINGPTYSGKLSRNRNAGSNGVWPSFGDADDDEEAGVGSLFLRGASSHCLIAPDTGGTFSLELCRSREHGTLLTLDADGRFIDEGDTLELCASGNAAEAGAELMMAAKGSCPDPAFEHTSGAALKHSTTGKEKRDKINFL
jgi:hypothetical protein